MPCSRWLAEYRIFPKSVCNAGESGSSGYLRRNPHDAPDGNFNGYNFWLNKLNAFDGDFVQAEMVKAFLSSSEYRQRFGP
jgi:hypothetical protein